MNKLIDILNILNRSERQKLRSIVRINSKESQSLKEKLLNILLKKPNIKEDELIKKLYNGKDASYFNTLKNKLFDDVIATLISQNNDKLYVDEIPQNELACLKYYIIGRLALSRSELKLGISLLEKAERIADKFGFYNEALMIKDYLRVTEAIRKGIKYIEKKNEQIEEISDLLKYELLTKGYTYDIGIHSTYVTNFDEAYISKINNTYKKSTDIFEQCDNPKVAYWHEYSSSLMCEINNDYETAISHYDKLLDIIHSSKQVYGTHRHISIVQNKVNALFRLDRLSDLKDNLEDLIYSSKRIKMNLPKNHFFYRFKELELRIAIKEVDELKFKEIIEVLKESEWGKTPHHSNRLKLFESYFQYKLDNKQFALELLSEVTEITKDKSGWLLGVYYLKMITLMDLEEYYSLDFHIKNFEHLLFRQKKKNILRTKMIVKVFKTLIRKHADYASTYEKHEDVMELLASNENNFYWDPLGFEIIRFDEWFNNKLQALN